jgi:DNA-binding winged helix-turn-helix (wHTH) protein
MTSSGRVSPIRFGVFEINPRTGELRKQGLQIKLGQQPLKLLLLLLERPGEIRTREELRRQIWLPDTFVDFEHSLNKAVYLLREALGDSVDNPRYIETIAGQGYRFIPMAPVGKQESVAVLPLAVDSPNPELEFLGERIVESVIDTISQIPGIRVLAYSTVQNYRSKDLDPRTVGENLLVQSVVTGEIIRRKDELLLHVELIAVDDGAQLWGARFKEHYTDDLALFDKLADGICAQLRAMLTSNVSRREKEQTEGAA